MHALPLRHVVALPAPITYFCSAGFQKLNEDGGAFGGFGGEEDFEQFKAAPPPPTDSAGQIHSPRPPPSSPNGALSRNGDHQRIMVRFWLQFPAFCATYETRTVRAAGAPGMAAVPVAC